MRQTVDDRKIKDLVHRYREGEGAAYPEIVGALSEYAYSYPRVVFGTDIDTCSDFYEYVVERLKRIIPGYRESEARFITWFTVVLRNSYLNFVRERKTRRKVEDCVSFVSFDFSSPAKQSLHNLIGDVKYELRQNSGFYDELLDDIVKNLRENHRVFFHLYFIESIRPEDVGFLSIELGRSHADIIKSLDAVRNSMRGKYQLKNRLLQRISDLFYDIVKNQRDGFPSLAQGAKKKREKVLLEYRRVKLNPSYGSIAEFLGIPAGTVSTGIMRMKQAVRSILKEKYHEKVSL